MEDKCSAFSQTFRWSLKTCRPAGSTNITTYTRLRFTTRGSCISKTCFTQKVWRPFCLIVSSLSLFYVICQTKGNIYYSAFFFFGKMWRFKMEILHLFDKIKAFSVVLAQCAQIVQSRKISPTATSCYILTINVCVLRLSTSPAMTPSPWTSWQSSSFCWANTTWPQGSATWP